MRIATGTSALARRRRHPGLRRRAHDLADVLLRHRPGVDAHARGPGLDRRQRQPPVVVDVGDDRHVRLAHDARERRRLLRRRQAHAHDLATGGGQSAHLPQRRLRVAGPRAGHRLHRDGRAAAHGDGADHDAARARHGRLRAGPAPHSPRRRRTTPTSPRDRRSRLVPRLPAEHPAGAARVGARVADVALTGGLEDPLEPPPGESLDDAEDLQQVGLPAGADVEHRTRR